MYARPIQQLIGAFKKLPGVGERTAERFVFSLLKSGKKDVAELQLALKRLIETVRSCETCWDFSDASPCAVCADKTRDSRVICVVSDPQDVQVFERMGSYSGRYHVLRGVLRPDDESASHLKIPELLERALAAGEVILALNPDLPGETTMLFLEKRLKEAHPAIAVSRLAKGLPMGSDVQYADEVTLASALRHRVQVK